MSFTFSPQHVPEVLLIQRSRYADERGVFSESYKRSEFRDAGFHLDFVQDNLVHSTQHVLRGLHYQLPPAAQGKLVSVVRGRILDVAVDLRRGEHTFGKYVAVELSSQGGEMLWIPPGFAHGYLVLTNEADVYYKVTAEYAPDLDRGIRWNDSAIDIPWPAGEAVLSAKDRALPLLADAENPF